MIQTAEEFRQLRLSTNEQDNIRASSDGAPDAVWREIISRWPDMKFWVAHNRTVPFEILDVLSRDSDPRVRARVAMRRSLPEDVRSRLARDSDTSVAAAVIENKTTPPSLLETLANHAEDLWIRTKAEEELVARRR